MESKKPRLREQTWLHKRVKSIKIIRGYYITGEE